MILHVNHLHPGLGARLTETVGALLALVEEGHLDPRALPALRVHLDWIQYRANFRDPVIVRRATDREGAPLGLSEIAIDVRQAEPGRLRADLAGALAAIGAEPPPERGRVFLEGFGPLRTSVIWRFNRLFWQRLDDWEAAAGRSFDEALPSGRSDANHPQAVADAVADFWALLAELDKRGQLPAELFALEIGVGSGKRASLWLDRFKALDDERGTKYYPRLRFLLGDYSMPALDRAMAAVARHQDAVSVIGMDALNPFRTLSFLRFKVLYVHLTNVYDNLPSDELVRRDGRLYVVEARPYLPGSAVERLASAFEVSPAELPRRVQTLVDAGPDLFGDRSRGVAFWREVWDALRLEERLVALGDVVEAPLPPGLDQHHLEDLLAEAPEDVRFHLSRGAAESFVNTLPLLHPRGYLQVQDIFVTEMDDYRHGFRGPGKLDGSVVNWVNGGLLRAVGERAGYEVHFTPFHYRPGSRTSILYTTQRD
ncbi:MAG: hypothetical protein HY727_06430 [Candidatus Rokubacteria bacterium]|nr:hypothetical protein [Candidatus Rokubacteria bacterium]